MAGLAEQRYALSLFEVAKEENKISELLKDLTVVDDVFKEHPDLLKILCAPTIANGEKLNIIDNIFLNRIDIYVVNFLKLLTEKTRISNYSQIVVQFKLLYNEYNNIEEIDVITAVALSAALKEKLRLKMNAVTGKNVVMHYSIDESMLGGIILKIKNELIDSSVKTRLESLKSQIQSIIA